MALPCENTIEVEAQTRIQCYPFYLDANDAPRISSVQATQTIISFKPDEDNKDIYQRLAFLSSDELYENVLRIVIAKRRAKLEFRLPSIKSMVSVMSEVGNEEFFHACIEDLIYDERFDSTLNIHAADHLDHEDDDDDDEDDSKGSGKLID